MGGGLPYIYIYIFRYDVYMLLWESGTIKLALPEAPAGTPQGPAPWSPRSVDNDSLEPEAALPLTTKAIIFVGS